MSRGFVKEEDQEEAPIIPPRAPLPRGEINYVTPQGHRALLDEKKQLQEERKSLSETNETERRRAAAVIDGKLNLLNERIASARVLNPAEQPPGEVRFGATVELENLQNQFRQKFQIVGVDEADVKQQKIAFTAPIARAVTGKKTGETTLFKLGAETRKLKVVSVVYK